MLGASCKKIVLQLAVQDIGQLTDFGSTAVRRSATAVPGAPGPAGRTRSPARSDLNAWSADDGGSVADDGDHGPRTQVDAVAVAQRHGLARRDVPALDHDAVRRAGAYDP